VHRLLGEQEQDGGADVAAPRAAPSSAVVVHRRFLRRAGPAPARVLPVAPAVFSRMFSWMFKVVVHDVFFLS
jgi:hypothetical protein